MSPPCVEYTSGCHICGLINSCRGVHHIAVEVLLRSSALALPNVLQHDHDRRQYNLYNDHVTGVFFSHSAF